MRAANASVTTKKQVQQPGKRRFLRLPVFRTLRAQLIFGTLLPLTLLVAAFAIVGQIGYTQVTESLARSRNSEIARVEAARMGDYLSRSVQSLQDVAESPVLAGNSVDPTQAYYTLRNEPVIQNFDLVQVSDKAGKVIAESHVGRGGALLSQFSFGSIQQSTIPMIMGTGTLKDGREAIVISVGYIDQQGAFAGVVEGAIALGSAKLSEPFNDTYSGGSDVSDAGTSGALSYVVDSTGRVLWHPDSALTGKHSTFVPVQADGPSTAGALITRLDGVQSVVGYAPLNLGLLLPRTYIQPGLVQWYVVTQEPWANVVAPVNSLLFGLLFLAALMLLCALVLTARSATALTRPVAGLLTASRALSAGRLRHRLTISGPAEVEELAEQFNVMASQLQSSYQALERKVDERTRALATANTELERRLLESQTIQRVAGDLAGTAGLDEILQTIASSVTDTLGTEGSIVFLPCPDNPRQLEAALVWNPGKLPSASRISVDESLSGLAFTTGEAQIVENAAEHPTLNRRFIEEMNARSLLAVPLVSRGQIIGAITTFNKKAGHFTDEDLRLITLLANQAAVAVERARLYSDTQRQLQTLETINELALSVTVSRSLEDTLVGGMEHIGKLLGASGAAVFLYEDKENALKYAASYNLTPAHWEVVARRSHFVPVDETPDRPVAVLDAFLRQEPVVVPDLTSPEYLQPWLDFLALDGSSPAAVAATRHLGALIALPLSVHDKRLGTMALYFSEPRQFKSSQVELDQSFANILALAVYNTQLLQKSSKLATVEERARLARELHDSVTQSLFSLHLTLRAATRKLPTDHGQALKLLESAQELAQGSLAEMRALIFELRPQALENEGLASALQKHADAVRARSGLDVHLRIDGERRLPIESEEALYQIAREALHNVVKHAQATEAWVDLEVSTSEVCLSVRDNGCGFDPTELQNGGGSHIGTSTMRERAEAIGGKLEINSAPQGGSEIVARVTV
ncbi:MAG TPA: GAF domain-containing protein [Chloroflexia bacterium]|jgi:nitrate/nitrite-specific signal transduction histidine kinase